MSYMIVPWGLTSVSLPCLWGHLGRLYLSLWYWSTLGLLPGALPSDFTPKDFSDICLLLPLKSTPSHCWQTHASNCFLGCVFCVCNNDTNDDNDTQCAIFTTCKHLYHLYTHIVSTSHMLTHIILTKALKKVVINFISKKLSYKEVRWQQQDGRASVASLSRFLTTRCTGSCALSLTQQEQKTPCCSFTTPHFTQSPTCPATNLWVTWNSLPPSATPSSSSITKFYHFCLLHILKICLIASFSSPTYSPHYKLCSCSFQLIDALSMGSYPLDKFKLPNKPTRPLWSCPHLPLRPVTPCLPSPSPFPLAGSQCFICTGLFLPMLSLHSCPSHCP